MRLKMPADASGLRKVVLEAERITDHWERLAGRAFDEETNVGKLRELIASGLWKFIAQEARAAVGEGGGQDGKHRPKMFTKLCGNCMCA